MNKTKRVTGRKFFTVPMLVISAVLLMSAMTVNNTIVFADQVGTPSTPTPKCYMITMEGQIEIPCPPPPPPKKGTTQTDLTRDNNPVVSDDGDTSDKQPEPRSPLSDPTIISDNGQTKQEEPQIQPKETSPTIQLDSEDTLAK